MELYNINKLRRKILPFNKIEDNKNVYEFLSFKTMIENYPFKVLYLDKDTYGTFLSEEQVINFLEHLKNEFDYTVSLEHIKSIKTDIFNSIPIEYYDLRDFTKKVQSHKPKKKEPNPEAIRLKNIHKYKNHLHNVCHIKKFKKIMSLDFEFKDDTITEAGISFYIPRENKLVHHYYIIKEHVIDPHDQTLSNNQRNKARKQKKFHFGKTRIIGIEHLKRIVYELIEESDCLVGHNIQSDFKLLDFTIDDLKKQNKKIIDTFFLMPAISGEYPNHTLRELCIELNINHSFMHNAGNDAAYTLICALRVRKYLRDNKQKINKY